MEPGESCATPSRLVPLNFCLYEKTGLTDAICAPAIHNFSRLGHPLARRFPALRLGLFPKDRLDCKKVFQGGGPAACEPAKSI